MDNRWGDQPECSEAFAEAAADWLITNPTQSLLDCATHFEVDPWDLARALRNETIRDRFDALAPDPPPRCPRCGGKSARITYGLALEVLPYPGNWCDYFSYAGPKLYACLADRTINDGCSVGLNDFCCTHCWHRWPTD